MSKEQKSVSTKHHSHLSNADRVIIEDSLSRGESFRCIAAHLSKSPSTISREVQTHKNTMGTGKNDCINKSTCHKNNLCTKGPCRTHRCKSCNIPCKKYCPDYNKGYCEILQTAPYVCNACHKPNCPYEQHYYRHTYAQKEYRAMLTERRNGSSLTGEQMEHINQLISPLILNGLSPYHIKQTLQESLPISEATLRRMIDKGEFDARNIDLRNQVKRKPRKKNQKLNTDNINISKIGHVYADYLTYIAEHEVNAVQMDCVEGIKEDKAVLLTLHFPIFRLQLAFIMNKHTSECVVDMLDRIENALGEDLFRQMFPIILTDNGHEFMDITGMERSVFGGKRTIVFFCDPNRPDQKAACENNHKMLRYIIPKGTSLESLCQSQITLMMNHINSYTRKELFGKSPYQFAMQVLPKDFFILLGLEQIPLDEIVLLPSLFRKK